MSKIFLVDSLAFIFQMSPFESPHDKVPTGSLRWLFCLASLRISVTVIISSMLDALSLAWMNVSKAPCGFATAPQPIESFPLPQFLLEIEVMHLFQSVSQSHCHSKLQRKHLKQYFPTLLSGKLFQTITKQWLRWLSFILQPLMKLTIPVCKSCWHLCFWNSIPMTLLHSALGIVRRGKKTPRVFR